MNADTMRKAQGKEDSMEPAQASQQASEPGAEDDTNPIGFDDADARPGDSDHADDDPIDHAENDDSGQTQQVLLDETEYGAVKDGVEIKAWQIDGLLKDNGNPHSPVFLKRNPPKLTFRNRNSDKDANDEYVVFLDKASARMLRDALTNVCNAYELKPLKKKHGKWTWQGFKDYIYDSFTDDPLKFIFKAAALVMLVGILVYTSISIRW